MKRLLLACLALLLLGAGPAPFTWGPWGEAEDTQNPVEQQTVGGATQPDQSLWVVNNTIAPPGQGDVLRGKCAWDADDSRTMGHVDGTLAPGVMVSGSKCYVADNTEHATYISLYAKTPDLVVAMRYDPQGFVVTASVQPDPNRNGFYHYEACGFGPYYDQLSIPPMQVIPNSGTAPNRYLPEVIGGVGVPSTVTAVVSNPTPRTVRDVSGVLRFNCCNPSHASGGRCPERFFEWVNGQLVYIYQRFGAYPGPSMWWWIP